MPDAVTDTHALIWYLQDDARLSLTAAQYFSNCEHDGGRTPDTVLMIVNLNLPLVLEMMAIPRDTVPDMPDRIIAATALYLKLPLISRDKKIRVSGLTTVW